MLTSKEKSDTRRLPMMPIRDVVIFPHMMTPFVVGRESSVRALEEALAGDKKIFLATQHDASVDEPRPDEIFSVGTVANIVQSLKQSDGNIKVLVEGVERGKILSVSEEEGYFRATVKTSNFKVEAGPQLDALTSRVTSLFEQYVKLSQNVNYDTMVAAIRGGRSGQAGRYGGRESAAGHRREAGAARNFRSHRPADARRGDARYRDREAQRRPHHSGPREAPDGEGAKRVLPQREDQGHPEGTGPRRKERVRRAEEEDRNRGHDQGRA